MPALVAVAQQPALWAGRSHHVVATILLLLKQSFPQRHHSSDPEPHLQTSASSAGWPRLASSAHCVEAVAQKEEGQGQIVNWDQGHIPVLRWRFHCESVLGECYLWKCLSNGACVSHTGNLNDTWYCASTRYYHFEASTYIYCPRFAVEPTAKNKGDCHKDGRDDASSYGSTLRRISLCRMRRSSGTRIRRSTRRRPLKGTGCVRGEFCFNAAVIYPGLSKGYFNWYCGERMRTCIRHNQNQSRSRAWDQRHLLSGYVSCLWVRCSRKLVVYTPNPSKM